jgi:hypothetical protein
LPKEPAQNQLAARVEALRNGLRSLDPDGLAARTGSSLVIAERGAQEFHLKLWGQAVILSYPDFTAREAVSRGELPVHLQALLLYYFNACDGTPAAGSWVSFSELPDGRFYNQAFQGYTGKMLAKAFGNDLSAFKRAAESLGGVTADLGDASFAFQALPRVPVLAVYWRGDEDFPPTCQILFDAAAGHHLPTDAYAILGSALAKQLIEKLR